MDAHYWGKAMYAPLPVLSSLFLSVGRLFLEKKSPE
jgi:hypothetical protein